MVYGIWSKTDEKEFLRILHLQNEIPDWEEVSNLLKDVNINRTATQCYMRWHRNKNKKTYNFNFSIGDKSWLIAEEKEFLRILSEKKKYPDWKEVSNQLKELDIDYSSKQCYNKWHRNKKKNESYNFEFNETKRTKLKYNIWTKVEESEFLKILKLQNNYPKWEDISKLLKELNINKTSLQCYNKWHWSKKKDEAYNFKFRCRTWLKEEENEFLLILKKQNEIPDWEEVSNLLKEVNVDRTATQCYMRWHRNKNNIYSNFNFGIKEKVNKFTKQEEKKILKLILCYTPKWQRIANICGDMNINGKIIRDSFFFILRESIKKACKLSNIKNGHHLFPKINPKLFCFLIKEEIKIDLREFKKCNLENKDKVCPDFIFLSFFEFINEIYFDDYEKICEKMSERGIFIIKKVVVYLIQMNLKDNYPKYRNYLLKFQKKIINTFKNQEEKIGIETIDIKKEDENIFEELMSFKSESRIFLEDDNIKDKEKTIQKKPFFKNMILIFERLKERKNEFIIEKKYTISYNPKTKIVFIKKTKKNTELFLQNYLFN